MMERTKWEYKVECIIPYDYNDTQSRFNKLGDSKWELVQIIENTAFFKRPKQD